MDLIMTTQPKRIHPHKFTLWVAICSIVMMFAGLTSAYIIKRNQANWLSIELPLIFWYSTAIIIISSITMTMSQKAFAEREMAKYRRLLAITTVLGFCFLAMQIFGFYQLTQSGITLTRNVASSFLYVLVGLHAAHVIAGVIALIIMMIRIFSSRVKNYSIVPVQMMSTYWHFVDILWIYLFVFLLMIK